MRLIRSFESMLESVKKQGHYQQIEYHHAGPAHLSIGQEAAAVGQAHLLDVDDHIFGSHRSHGEILAKGLSAIFKLDDRSLVDIMSSHFDGACLKIVEQGAKRLRARFGDRLSGVWGACRDLWKGGRF